jgi:hypothetical protein
MSATAAALDERNSWRQGANLRDQVMAEIRHELRASFFRFINLADSEVLLVVPIGMKGWVSVIGHPDFASYEWVVHHDPSFVNQLGREIYTGKRYEHSDSGYGVWESALQDGLNHVLD